MTALSAWSLPVRITHWLVVLGVLLNLVNETGRWHRWIGYGVMSVVIFRVVYGIWFTRFQSSRFYWPRGHQVRQHIAHLSQGRGEMVVGHNPLGQYAVYVMWGLIGLLSLTGWLSRTDRYWGEDWPAEIHAVLSNLLLAMIVMHITAVIAMSWLQKQNLIKRMLGGKHH